MSPSTILIDRVDLCFSNNDPKNRGRFLQVFHQLNMEYETLRIIMTSQYPAEEVGSAFGVSDAITEIWVDTTRLRIMYSR